MSTVPATVSVVVATRDRERHLERLLESLSLQTFTDFEIVVVDDGSGDGTRVALGRVAAAGALPLRGIRHERATGPAGARNTGWRAARGQLIAFTDDDVIVSPGWLEAGVAAWGSVPERFVQGRTEPDPDGDLRAGPFTRSLRVTALGPHFQTANIFYPRAMLDRMNGFDEAGFSAPGGEDSDLGHRCLEAGAQGVFAPDALVHHAVHQLGPIGKLRVAWRWTETVSVYRRHPAMRKTLVYGVFWKKSHYHVARALIALLLPKRIGRVRLGLLRGWLAQPLIPSYSRRGRAEGGSAWWGVYFLLHDVVELVAVVRGAVRYRTPVV